MLIILAYSLSVAANAESDVYLEVLGIAQDAAYPQALCYAPHCLRAWRDPSLRRTASSIAVVDRVSQQKFLFDATPDMREQLYRLHLSAPDDEIPLRGVFLTHAHIGHYAGLIHFGHEAASTKNLPVFVMPRFAEYLTTNGPWDQLVRFGNIALHRLDDAVPVTASDSVVVTPMLVPHRDEYSETVGFRIDGPEKSALYIPDIDKWGDWDVDIRDLVRSVDYALLDATFFADGELPGRDMSRIRHPFVTESMALFADLSKEERARVIFIHMNHTNPLLIEGSAAQEAVRNSGFRFAAEGLRLPL